MERLRRVFQYSPRKFGGVVVVVLVLFLVTLSTADETRTVQLGVLGTFLSALAALTVVLLTSEYVQATAKLVAETRDARLAQSRPQVLVYFKKVGPWMEIVVEHLAGGPAHDVRFAFSPPLVNTRGDRIGERPPFSTGIPMMPPGEKIALRFDAFDALQNQTGINEAIRRAAGRPTAELPTKFRTTITLRDPLADNQAYAYEFVLDLDHLMMYTVAGETQEPQAEPEQPAGTG